MSVDELRDRLGRAPRLVSSGGNLGYAGGNNVGIAAVPRARQRVSSGCSTPTPGSSPETLPLLIARLRRRARLRRGRLADRAPRRARRPILVRRRLRRLRSKTASLRHVHQGDVYDDVPAPRRSSRSTTSPGPPCWSAPDLSGRWSAAGGLLPLLRGDRLVPTRPPCRVAGHGRPAGPDGAPQEVERGPPLALPSVLHDTEPLPLRRARPRWGSRGGADAPARQWVRNWRRTVRKAAPEWLDEFDALVERAAQDARAGRDGRNDEVSHVPWPDDQGDAR